MAVNSRSEYTYSDANYEKNFTCSRSTKWLGKKRKHAVSILASERPVESFGETVGG